MITDEIFGYHIFLDKSKWGKGLTDEFGYSRFGDQFWDRFESPYFSNRFGLTNIFFVPRATRDSGKPAVSMHKKTVSRWTRPLGRCLDATSELWATPSDANGAQ